MLQRVFIPTPNHSARTSGVRLIVLHTAEGARTYQDLGAFFAHGTRDASSHCGADDTANTVGEYVKPDQKAWAVAAYNSESVNLELCAFAAWTRDEWLQHPHMLSNCAAWVAEEAKRFNIPIRKLTPAQAQGASRGVCQHVDLGAAGGGHHDCGPGFPIDLVLQLATTGPPRTEDYMAIATAVSATGALHVFVEAKDGSLWYTWQKKGESAWNGGSGGKHVAGLIPFAPAPV